MTKKEDIKSKLLAANKSAKQLMGDSDTRNRFTFEGDLRTLNKDWRDLEEIIQLYVKKPWYEKIPEFFAPVTKPVTNVTDRMKKGIIDANNNMKDSFKNTSDTVADGFRRGATSVKEGFEGYIVQPVRRTLSKEKKEPAATDSRSEVPVQEAVPEEPDFIEADDTRSEIQVEKGAVDEAVVEKTILNSDQGTSITVSYRERNIESLLV